MEKRRETIYNFEAVFEDNGEGYTVTIPKLPGLVTEGDNFEDAKRMAKGAIRCYIEALLKERMQNANSKKIENIKVAV